MTPFIKLDETDALGSLRGPVLVNVDAIILVTPAGVSHCALQMRSFSNGDEAETTVPLGVTSSRFFVAGTLNQIQIKLNCAGS